MTRQKSKTIQPARTTPGERPRWFWPMVVALPFAALVVLVLVFAVNVPVLDQWELVPMIEKYHQGTLGFSDFFAQHNEHRLFFPRAVMFGLAALTNWNVVWEMIASLVIAGAAFILIYMILTKTLAPGRPRWLAAGIISLIFFSPMQWENWLWGWQLQWYLNILGLVAAVWALAVWEVSPLKRVLVAAAAATLATYSLASGFFVWLVCLPLLWLIKPLRRWLWLWLVLAAAAVGLHYVGYVDPPYSPSRLLSAREPVAFVKYVLVYLAHPLTLQAWQTAVIAPLLAGGFGAALGFVLWRARDLLGSSLLPWLCLGLYAGGAAVSTAVTRLGLGIGQAYASRYTALSQLLLIALVVVLYKILELRPGRWPKRLATAGLVVISALVVLHYVQGVGLMAEQSAHLQQARDCALHATGPEDPCLTKLYPSPHAVWPRLEYLRSVHWGGL